MTTLVLPFNVNASALTITSYVYNPTSITSAWIDRYYIYIY